jgi:hypothetical protein
VQQAFDDLVAQLPQMSGAERSRALEALQALSAISMAYGGYSSDGSAGISMYSSVFPATAFHLPLQDVEQGLPHPARCGSSAQASGSLQRSFAADAQAHGIPSGARRGRQLAGQPTALGGAIPLHLDLLHQRLGQLGGSLQGLIEKGDGLSVLP